MEKQNNNSIRWPREADHLDSQKRLLSEQLLPGYLALLSAEKISQSRQLKDLYDNLYLPFCNWLAGHQNKQPLVVGINGPQGSGKSTLTKILQFTLESGFNKSVVALSIDDLYKTREERQQLARDIHPLLATRGVPGTHDIELANTIFSHLLNRNTSELNLPTFDKAIDDRLPPSAEKKFQGHCDIILFEGWCVGSCSQSESVLTNPVNKLEADEDPEGLWRQYVNSQLENSYQELFTKIDIQVMLKIPDFSKVFEWRNLQEQKLKNSVSESHSEKTTKTMSEEQIHRFIMHYERITRHTLEEMPNRCDIVFELGDDHLLRNIITRSDL